MLRTATLLAVLALALALASAPADAARPRQLQVVAHDTITIETPSGDMLWRLTALRAPAGQMLLMDQSASTPARVTPLGLTFPTGSTWGSFAADDDGTLYIALCTPSGGEVVSADSFVLQGPLAVEHLGSISMEGLDPASARLGIIAIMIGVVAEPQPALFAIDIGTSEAVVLGWNGDAFVPVRFDPTRGVYVEEINGG
jgi:hypothetical protein